MYEDNILACKKTINFYDEMISKWSEERYKAWLRGDDSRMAYCYNMIYMYENERQKIIHAMERLMQAGTNTIEGRL